MKHGIYRRRIQSVSKDNTIQVLLEDDPHCYHVTLEIENRLVRDASSKSIRTPWNLCPAAGRSLTALIGMEVSANLDHLQKQVDRSQQCTHMLDAALLGMSHAARDITSRQYDIRIESFPSKLEQHARLRRYDKQCAKQL